MAANLKDEEERDRRIVFVGEFAKETGYSTRKLSSILSSSYFKISNATVSDYLHRYMNMKKADADAIRKTKTCKCDKSNDNFTYHGSN